ncbi:hypothetical protein C8Q80DRAFT_1090595 [Daedaleopsis nitida]|nr:hypothetical protein C8Q80DRAFT_1090595 [Daedaleopsis nitida]
MKCRLVADVTTIRRHLGASHEGAYHAWAKNTGFVSMLPKDSAARRRAQASKSAEQTRLDPHLREQPKPPEQLVKYSDELFRDAAVEWLIATDQPLQALEHPSFKKMIHIAARSTEGVRIPNRKQTRAAIIDLFKKNLLKLRERLNVCWPCVSEQLYADTFIW